MLRKLTPRMRRLLNRAYEAVTDSIDRRLLRIARVNPADLVGPQALDEIVELNVGLIKTISRRHHEKISSLQRRRSLNALTRNAAAQLIQQELKVSTNRAKFWARDQGERFYAGVVRTRAKAVGLTRFRWVSSGDERVRDEHAELDGKVFTFDDPPVTNEQGDRNMPGEDYNCRCIAEVIA